eukprot:1196225-Prorocentrum_minimum.AAC.3
MDTPTDRSTCSWTCYTKTLILMQKHMITAHVYFVRGKSKASLPSDMTDFAKSKDVSRTLMNSHKAQSFMVNTRIIEAVVGAYPTADTLARPTAGVLQSQTRFEQLSSFTPCVP